MGILFSTLALHRKAPLAAGQPFEHRPGLLAPAASELLQALSSQLSASPLGNQGARSGWEGIGKTTAEDVELQAILPANRRRRRALPGGESRRLGRCDSGTTFVTPLFTNFPETMLAALILHALWHIVASGKLHTTRLVSHPESASDLQTFKGVILSGVLERMLIGLASTLLVIICRSSRPHVTQLGIVPEDPGVYSDIGRNPENGTVPDVLNLAAKHADYSCQCFDAPRQDNGHHQRI